MPTKHGHNHAEEEEQVIMGGTMTKQGSVAYDLNQAGAIYVKHPAEERGTLVGAVVLTDQGKYVALRLPETVRHYDTLQEAVAALADEA